MAKEFVLDIFQLLDKLSRNDLHIWETLTEEQQKAFSPLVTMRWMSGTSAPDQIICLNEFVNPYIFNLPQEHKELLLKLLATCGPGKPRRYAWQGAKGGKRSRPLSVKVIADSYQMTTRLAELELHRFEQADLIELAETLGWQKDEIALLKKEKE